MISLKNKRGFEMTISTVVLMILGIMLLIALTAFFLINWTNFVNSIKEYSGSDKQNALNLCQSQCNLENEYDFCCSDKEIGKDKFSCDEIKAECNKINCSELNCSN